MLHGVPRAFVGANLKLRLRDSWLVRLLPLLYGVCSNGNGSWMDRGQDAESGVFGFLWMEILQVGWAVAVAVIEFV